MPISKGKKDLLKGAEAGLLRRVTREIGPRGGHLLLHDRGKPTYEVGKKGRIPYKRGAIVSGPEEVKKQPGKTVGFPVPSGEKSAATSVRKKKQQKRRKRERCADARGSSSRMEPAQGGTGPDLPRLERTRIACEEGKGERAGKKASVVAASKDMTTTREKQCAQKRGKEHRH